MFLPFTDLLAFSLKLLQLSQIWRPPDLLLIFPSIKPTFAPRTPYHQNRYFFKLRPVSQPISHHIPIRFSLSLLFWQDRSATHPKFSGTANLLEISTPYSDFQAESDLFFSSGFYLSPSYIFQQLLLFVLQPVRFSYAPINPLICCLHFHFPRSNSIS